MDQHLTQLLVAILAVFGAGGVGTQIVTAIRERKRRTAPPLTDTAARIDIVKQLDAERTARAEAEQERGAADRRAEAADRRANRAEREADVWERYATDVREACLAHGTPLNLLPPRPILTGAAP